MEAYTKEMRVCDIVIKNPLTARVFHEKGIDFCCGGAIKLTDICEKENLNTDEVLAEIQKITTSSEEFSVTETTRATEIVDHILTRFHDTLKAEIPTLTFLMEKVARVHGGNHPELIQILTLFTKLIADLEPHMMKEEQVLFPIIKELDTHNLNKTTPAAFHCGSVNNPIQQMEHEHHAVGKMLSDIRELTNAYTLPEGACNSYRALYAGLEKLEYDLHLHIHMENNVLHPLAKQLEA